MDQIFTEKLRAYLEKPEKDRDIEEGATMLLQLERNKIHYKSLIAHRNIPIYRNQLFRSLEKHLNIRLQGLTLAEVKRMEPIAVEASKQVEEVAVVDESNTVIDHKGKRPDHDRLPETAKLQYQENLAILNKMRHLRVELDVMQSHDAKPCDMYEKLKQLLDLDDQRLQNWADYDAAVPCPLAEAESAKPEAGTAASESAEAASEDAAGEAEKPADIAKEMGAARAYISRNLAALEELSKDETKLVEYNNKKQAMQNRYARLVELGGSVKDETAARLNALGITV